MGKVSLMHFQENCIDGRKYEYMEQILYHCHTIDLNCFNIRLKGVHVFECEMVWKETFQNKK